MSHIHHRLPALHCCKSCSGVDIDMTDSRGRMNERWAAMAHVGVSFEEMYLKIWTRLSLSMRMILRFHYYSTLQLTLNRRTAALCCHSGAGLYGEPIHAPNPQSTANRMAEEADLWLHSHTWFHYALVKTAPSTTNAAVQVLCLFGRGCGWKHGGGKG